MVGIPGLSFTSQKTNVNTVNTSSLAFNPTVSASVGGSVGQAPSGNNRTEPQALLTSNDTMPSPFGFTPQSGISGALGAASAALGSRGKTSAPLSQNQFSAPGLSQAGISPLLGLGVAGLVLYYLYSRK